MNIYYTVKKTDRFFKVTDWSNLLDRIYDFS